MECAVGPGGREKLFLELGRSCTLAQTRDGGRSFSESRGRSNEASPHPTVADKVENRNKDFKKACDVTDARGSRVANAEALRAAAKQDVLNSRSARASDDWLAVWDIKKNSLKL